MVRSHLEGSGFTTSCMTVTIRGQRQEKHDVRRHFPPSLLAKTYTCCECRYLQYIHVHMLIGVPDDDQNAVYRQQLHSVVQKRIRTSGRP
jgi:hypothetical protein